MSAEFHTLIYPVVFYFTSLFITFPFARYMKYHEARLVSLLILSLSTFALTYFIPLIVPMLSTFAFWCYFVFFILFYAAFYSEKKVERSEIVFFVVFLFIIFLRFLFPDILDCEKMMDSAFMNAILVSNSLPPNDPFFAGKVIDFYYYFGHLIAACITILSFAPPEIGYNITLAALPAYTAILIYGFLREFVKLKYAVAGVMLSIFSGDLYAAGEFFRRIAMGIQFDFSYYWNPTRIVWGTINEFPYFSFIHGDMHAHVIAIPIKVLFLSILYNVWKKDSKYLYLLPPLLFIIFATNSWDFPLMFCLAALVALVSDKKTGVKILAFSAISVPFIFVLFKSMNVPAAKTYFVIEKASFAEFFLYASFPVILAYLYFLPSKLGTFLKSLLVSIIVAPLCPVLATLFPLAVLAASEFKNRDFHSVAIFVGVLAFVIPEFIAIESRTNTVFKFYLIGWLLFTISPATKFESYERVPKILLTLILVFSLIYPFAATPIRYSAREFTLDGMNYMKAYDGDYYAVKWIRERAGKSFLLRATTGVVMEAGHASYTYGGRVAAFTGNPAVIAWANHEYFWRRDAGSVHERAEDVKKFYTTDNCATMRGIADRYHVTFIFVGYEEKRVFNANKTIFDSCFKKVFEKDGTAVYRNI